MRTSKRSRTLPTLLILSLALPGGQTRAQIPDAPSPAHDHGAGVEQRSFRLDSGEIYEGQIKNDKRNGLGVLWEASGAQVAQCGIWRKGELFISCPVPRSALPFPNHLSSLLQARALEAQDFKLIYSDSSYYIGEVDAQNRPHGQGTLYFIDGKVKQAGPFLTPHRWLGRVLADNPELWEDKDAPRLPGSTDPVILCALCEVYMDSQAEVMEHLASHEHLAHLNRALAGSHAGTTPTSSDAASSSSSSAASSPSLLPLSSPPSPVHVANLKEMIAGFKETNLNKDARLLFDHFPAAVKHQIVEELFKWNIKEPLGLDGKAYNLSRRMIHICKLKKFKADALSPQPAPASGPPSPLLAHGSRSVSPSSLGTAKPSFTIRPIDPPTSPPPAVSTAVPPSKIDTPKPRFTIRPLDLPTAPLATGPMPPAAVQPWPAPASSMPPLPEHATFRFDELEAAFEQADQRAKRLLIVAPPVEEVAEAQMPPGPGLLETLPRSPSPWLPDEHEPEASHPRVTLATLFPVLSLYRKGVFLTPTAIEAIRARYGFHIMVDKSHFSEAFEHPQSLADLIAQGLLKASRTDDFQAARLVHPGLPWATTECLNDQVIGQFFLNGHWFATNRFIVVTFASQDPATRQTKYDVITAFPAYPIW